MDRQPSGIGPHRVSNAPKPKPLARDDVWLDKPAPRYTSYPPASVFHDGMTGHDYGQALKALSPDQDVSLYLHIPFCRNLCLYCACHTSVTHRQERVKGYLASLAREMALVAGQWPEMRRVARVHVGGGSPNIMNGRQMRSVFGALRQRFDLRDCREIAMELDPRLVDAEQIEAMAECGVTRVSLGVQDFDPGVQGAVNREQPLAMIEQVCADLRAAGIRHINIDLMYGLPLQTVESMAQTARLAVQLSPDRMALFSYAHVPGFKPHQRALESLGLPDKCKRLALEQSARAVFVEAGFVEIGIDHFARPHDPLAQALGNDTLRRNFQGYTDDDYPLIGLGASAIGKVADGYFQNEKDEKAYRNKLGHNTLATVRGVYVSCEDRVRAAIIEKLMCALSCDIERICQNHGYPLAGLAAEMAVLEPLEEAGVIRRQGSFIELTTGYRMAARVVGMVFDGYAARTAAVASRAA